MIHEHPDEGFLVTIAADSGHMDERGDMRVRCAPRALRASRTVARPPATPRSAPACMPLTPARPSEAGSIRAASHGIAQWVFSAIFGRSPSHFAPFGHFRPTTPWSSDRQFEGPSTCPIDHQPPRSSESEQGGSTRNHPRSRLSLEETMRAGSDALAHPAPSQRSAHTNPQGHRTECHASVPSVSCP